MNQKQFEDHIKRQFVKFGSNMCVVCIHNKGCMLPLHGKVIAWGEPCLRAELIPEKEFMMWAAKNLYCMSHEQCVRFEEKMKERMYE